MLVQKHRAALGIAPRQEGGRAEKDVDPIVGADPKEPEAEPPAEIAEPRVGLSPFAADREPRGQPDLVAGRGAVDALQDELEIERLLEFAHHEHRRLAFAQAEQVAAADLALHGEAEPFEEAFDGFVELGLGPA